MYENELEEGHYKSKFHCQDNKVFERGENFLKDMKEVKKSSA